MVLGKAALGPAGLVRIGIYERLRRLERGRGVRRDDRQPAGAQAAGAMAAVAAGGVSAGNRPAGPILPQARQQTDAHLDYVSSLCRALFPLDLLHWLPSARR